MIPTIIRISKESVYFVLTIVLKDNKQNAPTTDFPEFGGVIITGDQKVASTCGPPACSIFGEWQEGMLRNLKCLCLPRDHKEQLPQFSSNCSDSPPCRATGMELALNSPRAGAESLFFPQPPPRLPGHPSLARHLHEGPLTIPAPKAMMSAAPPVPSAKQLVLSGDQLAMSVEKPMPEHTSALLAAQEENSTADMDPFLPQQAQRAWHKQQYGVSSVTGTEKRADHETPLVLDRQNSPASPLDLIESLDSTHTPPPSPGGPPSKSTSGVPSSSKVRGDPKAAAGLPELSAPGSCTKSGDAPDLPLQPMLSAIAAAASCSPNFFESNDEEDPAQVEDGFRTAKSYDWLVDELLDMSVASLLASSPRHPSSPLSRQHQQATFGGVAVQEKLIDGR